MQLRDRFLHLIYRLIYLSDIDFGREISQLYIEFLCLCFYLCLDNSDRINNKFLKIYCSIYFIIYQNIVISENIISPRNLFLI